MRDLRDQLGLTMRDVHRVTRKVGKQRHNSDYIVSPSRLSDIEKHGHTPNLYRLHALALAYHCKEPSCSNCTESTERRRARSRRQYGEVS